MKIETPIEIRTKTRWDTEGMCVCCAEEGRDEGGVAVGEKKE